MTDSPSLEEILSTNPFAEDGPDKYTIYLNAALQLVWANVKALTKAVEVMQYRIEEHDRMHHAASISALSLPDSPLKDEKPN